MILAILAVYVALLFLLEKKGLIRWTPFWKASPAAIWAFAQLAILIPMGWAAPQGPVIVGRNSVQIIPSVVGEVIEVAAERNSPLKAGDVLFRIDPVPYEAALKTVQAQLSFAQERLAQAIQLQERDAGRMLDVQERAAHLGQLKAQFENASWNLERTVVRAPSDGFVTNVSLRKGARVGNTPVMAFFETSETTVLMEVNQINARFIQPRQNVEVAFKFAPGQILRGRVRDVLPAISSGQGTASGLAITPVAIQASPFVVTIDLDDQIAARRMPVGAVGDATVYTDEFKLSHIIRKVIIRQTAILNYVNPF